MNRPAELPPSRVESLAVLSDVHLGRGGRVSSCRIEPARLVALIEELSASHDLVVLNGDLFDLERGPIPFAHGRELRLLSLRHETVVDAIHRCGVVVLAGNHDREIVRKWGSATSLDVAVGPWRVRLEHGERFDAPIKQIRRFATAVTWTSGRVQAAGLGRLHRAMRKVESLLTGEKRGRLDSALEEKAARWLSRAPFDVLVLGHTHRRALTPVGGRWLANPGDAMAEPAGYLRIDGREGLIELCETLDGRSRVSESARLASPLPFDK